MKEIDSLAQATYSVIYLEELKRLRWYQFIAKYKLGRRFARDIKKLKAGS